MEKLNQLAYDRFSVQYQNASIFVDFHVAVNFKTSNGFYV